MPMMRAVPLSELLGPVTLDPLTVVQDSGFVDRLAEKANNPAPVMAELRKLYDCCSKPAGWPRRPCRLLSRPLHRAGQKPKGACRRARTPSIASSHNRTT